METPLGPESRLVRAEGIVSAELEGEMALLSVERGAYFGMDPIASRIWTLIDGERTIGEICEVLLEEFEVEPSRCREDVLAYGQELERQGLARRQEGAGSSP